MKKRLNNGLLVAILVIVAAVAVVGTFYCVAGGHLPAPGVSTNDGCDDLEDIIERDRDCGFTDKNKPRNTSPPKPQVSKRR